MVSPKGDTQLPVSPIRVSLPSVGTPKMDLYLRINSSLRLAS